MNEFIYRFMNESEYFLGTIFIVIILFSIIIPIVWMACKSIK